MSDIFTSPIYSVSEDGSGIARCDGYTVFVKGAVIGDECKIRITKRNKTYGFGTVVDILKPSSSRIEPICPQFEECGGCTLLHTDYSTQLILKRDTVCNAVTRIGGFDSVNVHDTVPSTPHFNYRNKSQYPVGGTLPNVKIGFYAPRSHTVIDSQSCAIENPDARIILDAFRKWMTDYHIAPYCENDHTGTIRHIYSRIGESIMVVIVSRTREIEHLNDLKDSLLSLSLSKPIGGIVVNINSSRTNTILGKYDYSLYGEKFIYAKIENLTYKVNYKSFFQVNPHTTNLLYRKALELASLTGNETVFDLYCGIGTISLFLAQKAKKVIGVEIVPEAVDDARENASINNISNALFYCGATQDVCPPLIKAGERADVVVVDPPRKGCDEKLLEAIGKMSPEKIVYVSCNVSTFARDAKILCEKYGYEFDEIFPFDQFPHSMHVETVAKLVKKQVL